jgi:hypothetical protein
VTVYVITPVCTVELRTLTPDQLLDLLTDDHPAGWLASVAMLPLFAHAAIRHHQLA